MVVLSIRELISNKLFRQASRIFLILLVIIFTIAISLTSMETRHLGNFLISFIVLATIIDVRTEPNRVSLKLMNTLFYSSIFVIHLLWLTLKIF